MISSKCGFATSLIEVASGRRVPVGSAQNAEVRRGSQRNSVIGIYSAQLCATLRNSASSAPLRCVSCLLHPAPISCLSHTLNDALGRAPIHRGARVGVGEALRGVEREEAVGHPGHRFVQAIDCGHRFAPSEHDLTQSRPARSPASVAWRYHANNSETVAKAALAGLGIGLVRDHLCNAAPADGRLVRVLPTGTPQTSFGTRIIAFAPP